MLINSYTPHEAFLAFAAVIRNEALTVYISGSTLLRYCKHSLRRSKLDNRFGISHPPISGYCKLLRGILVRAMQTDPKTTHGQIVRS